MAALLFQTISLVLGAGAVEVAFAPDQPVPHIYLGESLVIAMTAEESGSVMVDVDIQSTDRRGSRQRLGPFDVVADQPYWFSVDGVPNQLGPYQVRIRSASGDMDFDAEATVVRVRRESAPAVDLPFGVIIDDAPDTLLYGLRTLRVPVVCVRGPLEELKNWVLRVSDIVESQVDVLVEAQQVPNDHESLEAQLGSASPRIRQWKISGSSTEQILHAAHRIKSVAPDAVLTPLIRSPEELETLLMADHMGWFQSAVVVASTREDELVAPIRELTRRLGYESFPITVLHDLSNTGHLDETDALYTLLHAFSNEDREIWLDSKLLYSEDKLQSAYGPVNITSFILGDATFYGSAKTSPGVYSPIFRYTRGDAADSEWVIVAWSDDGAKHALPWNLSDTHTVEIFDAWGNAMSVAPDEVRVSRSPIYLRGREGGLVEGIAHEASTRLATELVENDAYASQLNVEMKEMLKRIASHEDSETLQFEFLILLRSLVDLERMWHIGQSEPGVTIDIISRIASLVRHIGTLEQERGFSLLEPLDRTLATCAQFQREYRLMPAPENAARCEWLVLEIDRLTRAARKWMDAGREMEAKSVAALAEWRGRSLEIAARTAKIEAPVEVPESEDGEAASAEEKP